MYSTHCSSEHVFSVCSVCVVLCSAPSPPVILHWARAGVRGHACSSGLGMDTHLKNTETSK